ncbi:hypothetical protein WICMUC_000968 [Wickerhamomyces mucosus]|uniref:Uncharacterized protein n=1 Tax=Wickerhamomyces mucosus TaxID=1378264 RepID=A0A9P8PW96_9ASCO|nr:hypothetical protein WICMUC_000968 [Wickerhamomyces mucosus]
MSNSTLISNKSDPSSWVISRVFNALVKAVEDQSKVSNVPDRQAALSFTYFISPYAGACMTMAIILNRTVVFASSRSRVSNTLPKFPSIILRIVSLLILLNSLISILLQISLISSFVQNLISKLIDLKDIKIPTIDSFLWNIFISLCISQFLETFISITSGQLPSNDTGLTLFEHSLAFQECQFLSEPSSQLLSIVFFSIISQITIHLLGITGMKKYQLIPSTIIGISFLIYYCINAYNGGLIYFPSVVIISAIPQILVFIIITFCLSIYGFAVLVNGGSTESLTYTPMVENLRNSLNLQLNDDFNSSLMRFGYIMFTAVDNEEYVNELTNLNLVKSTYLDDDDDGKNHLLSNYFNKIENHPDLLNNDGGSIISKTNKDNETIVNNWIFLKKFINLTKLLQGITIYIYKKLFKKNKPKNSNNSKKKFKSQNHNFLSSSSTIIINDEDNELLDFDYIEAENNHEFSESDLEIEPLEYESDYETDSELDSSNAEYISNPSKARSLQYTNNNNNNKFLTDKKSAIEELYNSENLISLFKPQDLDEISFQNSIKYHLLNDKRITRSQYCLSNEDDILKEVILTNRKQDKHHIHDNNEEAREDYSCVVCQTNPRSIIIWPCKCFAICENCRREKKKNYIVKLESFQYLVYTKLILLLIFSFLLKRLISFEHYYLHPVVVEEVGPVIVKVLGTVVEVVGIVAAYPTKQKHYFVEVAGIVDIVAVVAVVEEEQIVGNQEFDQLVEQQLIEASFA